MTRNHRLVIFFLILLTTLVARSQVHGPNSPASGSQSGSNTSWTNPSNIVSTDNTYSVNANYGTTNQLIGTNFGFSLPSTDLVQGIQLDIERKYVPQDPIARIGAWEETRDSTMSYTLPAGNNRILCVFISAENGTDNQDYQILYDGIALTFADGITVQTGGTFTATLELWYLLEADLPADGAHTLEFSSIAPLEPYVEYFTSFAAGVYENVDQNNPFETFVTTNSTSNTASLQLSSPLTNVDGTMSLVAAFCGQNVNPSPKTASGQTECWTINQSFAEQVDVYRCNDGFASTGGTMLVADKSYNATTADQPTVTFAGTPNRRVLFGMAFKRSGVIDKNVNLLKAGSIVGSDYANTTDVWPLADAYESYGGATDLWGTSWTHTDINNADFGASLVADVLEGTAQVDHYTITVYTVSTLPIDLVNFTWERHEDFTELYWLTATEVNSSHFEVEISSNGKDFSFMASIPAQGESQGPQYYSYKDYQSVQKKVYYRLKMVDRDGSFEYSNIQYVNAVLTDDVLYPNPARNTLNLPFLEEGNQAYILNNKGEIVKTVEVQKLTGPYEIDVRDLPDGAYYLMFQQEEANLERKMLKFQKISR
ncbi:MAG: T9SS type A sorting domain-containing protein [Crocinitomicaceae bacterium]|nr:T9SS type A sorting domain-containing protein [Crocinitomicaceae bacterium]